MDFGSAPGTPTKFRFQHAELRSSGPTEEDLDSIASISPRSLGPTYKRNLLDRIFVNRDLRLDKIKWLGFDMDYTLAAYKSSEYEILSYDLLVQKLLSMGYPKEIETLKFNPDFPIRGLLVDRKLGNLIKLDHFGYISHACHGHTSLKKEDLVNLYPSLYIASTDVGKRYFSLDTLFNTPEACLYADLVEYCEKSKKLSLDNSATGFSFENIFQDIRTAMDFIHLEGGLKTATLQDLNKYLDRNEKLSTLFHRIRESGKKIFLLTNSEFAYTDKIMKHLFEGFLGEYSSWRDFFDVIIVGARKPLFFSGGTALREVDLKTGNLKIENTLSFEKGHVYQGGSIELFDKWAGIKGNQVLYVGDHIYADIIKSKKHTWRNLLIVPELKKELQIWKNNVKNYNQLVNLEFMKSEVYKNTDSTTTSPPDIDGLRKRIKQVIKHLDDEYNPYFGSLLRCGKRHSYFGWQVERYADLYTYDFTNLLNYPLFYIFSASYSLLPHEALGSSS